jgi:hypothetical protein
MDATGSGSCPMAGFVISCVEHSGSAARDLGAFYVIAT